METWQGAEEHAPECTFPSSTQTEFSRSGLRASGAYTFYENSLNACIPFNNNFKNCFDSYKGKTSLCRDLSSVFHTKDCGP